MNLKRPMFAPSDSRGPTIGKDVQIAKFGIGRYENDILPKPSSGYTQTFGAAMEEAVKQIQKAEQISASGNIGQATWDVIWPLLDAYRQLQYRAFRVPPPPPTPEEIAFGKLLSAMKLMHENTPGYLLGGGHGVPLSAVSSYQKLDCSSSTSKALYEADLFEGREYALVSGQFYEWGEPGEGKFFTVYYNSTHVWTRLHKSAYWRFDTSPHGDGGRGPHLRYLPRFTGGFSARHWAGM